VVNAVPALIAAKRFGLPVVYEIRAFWEDAAVTHGTTREGSLRYRLTQRLETFVARHVNAVTTISEGLREDLEIRGIPAHKITVIPNAVDIDLFPFQSARDPAIARRLDLGSETVLGYVGSFYAYEGLDYLIRAVAKLRQEQVDISLVLVGGGPQEDALRTLSSSLGISDGVTFTGRVPHNAVAKYYSVLDLLIYPRISSRLTELVTPLKPLEAMAQGKLVIASNVGGHRELIEDGRTGRLFEPGNIDAIVSAIREILANRDGWSKQAERARRFVADERTWPRSVGKYEQVYEELRPSQRSN
jgi:PEP-CTERM/exosortase A-associated glycosyltransferase